LIRSDVVAHVSPDGFVVAQHDQVRVAVLDEEQDPACQPGTELKIVAKRAQTQAAVQVRAAKYFRQSLRLLANYRLLFGG